MFLPNVRDIVKVAAGGVIVDFVVVHYWVPCPKLSVPCLIVTRFPFQARAASSLLPLGGGNGVVILL